MMRPAPSSLQPMVAESPTAPWAKIATVSPNSSSACSAPMNPVESISVAYTAWWSESPSGIGVRLACALLTRKYWAIFPSLWTVNLAPPSILPWHWVEPALAVVALEAGSDARDRDAVSLGETLD